MKLKRSSWLRTRFELWLMRKFMLRFGPDIIQRRGYWWFIDRRGDVWRLEATDSPDTPLRITPIDRTW